MQMNSVIETGHSSYRWWIVQYCDVSVSVVIKQPGQIEFNHVNETVNWFFPFVLTSKSSHKFQQKLGLLSVDTHNVEEKKGWCLLLSRDIN